MASHTEPRPYTYKAGGTISKNTFVKFGSADDTVLACGAGERGIGVAVEDAVLGGYVEVHMLGGGSKVKAGAGFARGQLVKSNASGQAIKAAAAGDFCVGIAMQTALTNDVVAIELMPTIAAAAEA